MSGRPLEPPPVCRGCPRGSMAGRRGAPVPALHVHAGVHGRHSGHGQHGPAGTARHRRLPHGGTARRRPHGVERGLRLAANRTRRRGDLGSGPHRRVGPGCLRRVGARGLDGWGGRGRDVHGRDQSADGSPGRRPAVRRHRPGDLAASNPGGGGPPGLDGGVGGVGPARAGSHQPHGRGAGSPDQQRQLW